MNMTGDPNQQNRPNIFGEDYNYPNSSVDWNRFTSSSNCYTQPDFPFCSNFGSAPVTFPIHTDGNVPNNYLSNVYSQLVYPSTSQYNYGDSRASSFRCKRKTDSPPPVATKQHITEEKMAEHLSKLHISSETVISNELDENRTRRLYMCEEMRKLQTEAILPATLLNKIQRPCTALVLWQPPQRLIPVENEPADNNNEEEVPDNNLMETDGR